MLADIAISGILGGATLQFVNENDGTRFMTVYFCVCEDVMYAQRPLCLFINVTSAMLSCLERYWLGKRTEILKGICVISTEYLHFFQS
jgi:hypothetical protein